MDNLDPTINELISHFSTEGNREIQYGHPNTEMEKVVENPEEYIIPECLPACKALWEKNIFTFMVSNYDNEDLYIEIEFHALSEENQNIMYKKVEEYPENYRFGQELLRIRTLRDLTKAEGVVNQEAVEKLVLLTKPFVIQDTQGYDDAEDFLWDYTHTNELEMGTTDQYGHINVHRKEDPALAGLTLKEVLQREGKEALYIAEEGRVYKTPSFLEGHRKYLESIKIANKKS